jgi:tetrahydromethanopterin S-methyltransferase subunit A
MDGNPFGADLLEEAIAPFGEAAGAKKCWSCGCLHGAIVAAERAFGEGATPTSLARALAAARARLLDVRYDCLGCAVCHAARALDALGRVPGTRLEDLDGCQTGPVAERAGWPPLAGSYTVLRSRAPVAVCTLTDDRLVTAITREAPESVAVVGTLQTENLGIERLITNVVANPSVRFLIVAGADSRDVVGHLPGQSLLALARSGVDERGRIIGAHGKRPVLRNIALEAIEHFRRSVEVVDLVGHGEARTVFEAAKRCADHDPGPASAFTAMPLTALISGYLPERTTSDPAGYFVLYVDRARRVLSLEHYENDGCLDAIVEGRTAAEVYTPIVERGLVSRLDHAAYLGRELARAEHALAAGIRYVQDAAPERAIEPTPPDPACGAA